MDGFPEITVFVSYVNTYKLDHLFMRTIWQKLIDTVIIIVKHNDVLLWDKMYGDLSKTSGKKDIEDVVEDLK